MAKEDNIPGLAPDLPFAEAGRAIIRNRFAAMWKHRDGTLAGDEEALHDMRVGSRRLRAALDIFAMAFSSDRFRRLHRVTAELTDELGGVRDHDVMLLGLQRYRKGVPKDERAGIDDLMGTLTAERDLARRRLQRYFDKLDAQDYAGHMRQMFGQEEQADG